MMADEELYCEIRTTSGIYRDWVSVLISQSYDQTWTRTFKLQAAEPSRGMLRLKPEDRVDIALAGVLVIQEGYVVSRQVSFDGSRHAVQIDGFSKEGPLTKVSVDVPGGQFRGYRLDSIANTVLKPHGVRFRIENGPDGANEPFPNVAIRHGETPFALLKRLCRQRGLWMRADADGSIVAGSKDGGGGLVFEEGRNILTASCQITSPFVNSVIGRSQQPGSDSLFGRRAAEVSAKSDMPQGASGKRIILAEMPLSAKELQTRTNMAVQDIQSSVVRVSLTYTGWLKPGGGLWDLSETVKVRSPMLFPVENDELDLRLWGYTYVQDASGGTFTTLDLVNEATFGIKNASARAGDSFYSQPSKPAQAEVST